MDADEYIALYGANLTAAEKRYIKAFGPPQDFAGPSRRPETPAQTVGAAPTIEKTPQELEREEQLRATEASFARMREADEEEQAARELQDLIDEEEAHEAGEL